MGSLSTTFSVLVVSALYSKLYRAQADTINVTIDDQYGDALTGYLPQYLPSIKGWSQGANCPNCLAKPDASRAQDGTWHDATWSPGGSEGAAYSIDLVFNGSAIYVYCILANNIQHATTLTNLSFVLDGDLDGYFVHVPTNSSDYDYNQLVYSSSNLSSSSYNEHQLTINTVGATSNSLILFDYAVRTTNSDELVSLSSSSPVYPSTVTVDTGSTGGTDGASSTVFSSSLTPGSISTTLSAFTTSGIKPLHNNSLKLKSTHDLAHILGGTLGGIATIALFLLLCFVRKRNRQKMQRKLRQDILLMQMEEDSNAVRVEPFLVKVGQVERMKSQSVVCEAGTSTVVVHDINEDSTRHGVDNPNAEIFVPDLPLANHTEKKKRNGDVKRRELAERVEQMEGAIAVLHSQLSSASHIDALSDSMGNHFLDEQGLNNRILTLQIEMDILQARRKEFIRERSTSNMELLPNYDGA